MWWIVAGVIALAVVIAVTAVASVVGRLRPLERALRRLTLRAEQAQGLQASLDELRQRVEAVAPAAQQAAEHAQRVGEQASHLRTVQ